MHLQTAQQQEQQEQQLYTKEDIEFQSQQQTLFI